ncbi:MAG: hypothetical protein U0992_05610 [Planctomycetaceae bacterium]
MAANGTNRSPRAPGYGFATLSGYVGSAEPMKVRLPQAQSIRGRIIDLEGVPIAGAVVACVFNVAIAVGCEYRSVAGGRATYRRSEKNRRSADGRRASSSRFPRLAELPVCDRSRFPTLTTDADGRFSSTASAAINSSCLC